MMAQPQRLRAAAPPLRRAGGDAAWPEPRVPGRKLLRGLRAAARGVLVVLWTLLVVPVQAVLIRLPGRAKAHLARFYWRVVTRLLGLRVRVIGERAGDRHVRSGRRPIVFVANHSSWLDIATLGGLLDACFVSKAEVGRWPGIGLVARLGRTVFVSRRAGETARERDEMRARLAGGDNLVLFPEGTSSDGSRVLPFRSAFFSIVEGPDPPLVQPVSLVYDRLGWLPTGKATRPIFAWYGGMDLAPHFWRFAQQRGLRATVVFHPALDPAAFPSRKALAQAAWSIVADSAAALRQNRPCEPTLAGGANRPAVVTSGLPARRSTA
jgi:lyso-ornithine lipid O-acyltransferase